MKIVVGVDGSEASEDALRFAFGESMALGADLVAVTVWEVPVMAAAYVAPAEVDEAMGPWMDTFVDKVLGPNGASVTKAPASGSAAAELLRAAEDADAMVMGTSGRGALSGVIMGSVSHQVANHAPCPLTVVPAGSNDGDGPGPGPAVVGVDGSANAGSALRWAAERAARVGVPLRIVMAWRGEPAGWLPRRDEAGALPTDEELQSQAREMLAEVVDSVELPGGLVTELVVGEGAPASVLRDAAEDASMLVLGARGRGGFMGLLLGSVTSHMLSDVFCPMTVVPAP
ncbi:MAG: universal stress protein [Microthrixaceae bacterium]